MGWQVENIFSWWPIPNFYASFLSSILSICLCSNLTYLATKLMETIQNYDVLISDPLYILKRMNEAIKYHLFLDAANNPQDADKLVEFCTNTTLIDDSYKVVTEYNTSTQLQSIPKEYILDCDINNCKSFQRHNRDRKQHQITEDPNSLFWIDLLDSMHCYLTHAFDNGLRVKQQDIQSVHVYDDEKTDNNNTCTNSLPFLDYRFQLISNVINLRRKSMERICALPRYDNNKFDLNVNDQSGIKDNTIDNTQKRLFMDELYDQLKKQNVSDAVWNKIQIEEEYDTDAVVADACKFPERSNLFQILRNNTQQWQSIQSVQIWYVISYFMYFYVLSCI